MTVDQSISRVRFSLDNPNDIRQLTTCVAKIKQTIFMNIIKLKERKKKLAKYKIENFPLDIFFFI